MNTSTRLSEGNGVSAVVLILFFSIVVFLAVQAGQTAAAAPFLQSGMDGSPKEAVPSTVTIESGLISVGETMTTSIDVDVPAPNLLTSFTYHIQYDPTILGYVDGACIINNAVFLAPLCNRSDSDGVPPDVISFTGIHLTGVNGNLNLGAIPFVGLDEGISNLVIVVGAFTDGSGEVPLTVDGTLEVTEPTAVTMGHMSAAAATGRENAAVLITLLLAVGVVSAGCFSLRKRKERN